MSEIGHRVLGVDLSPQMVTGAAKKAREGGAALRFEVGDVGHPDVDIAGFDVVLARHVLWTLTDPVGTLARWKELLRPGGHMVLIEGRWFAPSAASYPGDVSQRLPWNGGVTAATLTSTVGTWFDHVRLIDLAGWPELWGREVDDERFAVIAGDPKPSESGSR